MIITVEPGCYFIDYLLDNAINNELQKQFINVNVLNEYRNFGGVRIEDNVLVTKNGCEVLTKVPRSIDDIEKYMKQSN
jgi:Xaa-Pro dipeptidase